MAPSTIWHYSKSCNFGFFPIEFLEKRVNVLLSVMSHVTARHGLITRYLHFCFFFTTLPGPAPNSLALSSELCISSIISAWSNGNENKPCSITSGNGVSEIRIMMRKQMKSRPTHHSTIRNVRLSPEFPNFLLRGTMTRLHFVTSDTYLVQSRVSRCPTRC